MPPTGTDPPTARPLSGGHRVPVMLICPARPGLGFPAAREAVSRLLFEPTPLAVYGAHERACDPPAGGRRTRYVRHVSAA